jgi:hypothetical protein
MASLGKIHKFSHISRLSFKEFFVLYVSYTLMLHGYIYHLIYPENPQMSGYARRMLKPCFFYKCWIACLDITIPAVFPVDVR